jgi:hypothetical protein
MMRNSLLRALRASGKYQRVLESTSSPGQALRMRRNLSTETCRTWYGRRLSRSNPAISIVGTDRVLPGAFTMKPLNHRTASEL